MHRPIEASRMILAGLAVMSLGIAACNGSTRPGESEGSDAGDVGVDSGEKFDGSDTVVMPDTGESADDTSSGCRTDSACSGDGSVCDRETGACGSCDRSALRDDAVGQPPMNGYWYGKGYHFDWSPLLARKDWTEGVKTLVDKLGEPAVIAVGLSNNKWVHIRGDTEEHALIEPVARWLNKNDEKSRYTKEGRYAYYVSWLFPGEVRQKLGRDEAYRRAAAGEYNRHYRALAEKFKTHGMADQVIIRLHPEHNGDWQGYAGGNVENFKKAWRQYVETVRSVDEDIMFAYSPSLHQSEELARKAYPGDAYVDYLGVSGIHDGTFPNYEDEQKVCGEDCEYPDCSSQCNDKLFGQAWSYYRTHEFGLDAATAFAENHDLPMAFLEWGLKDKNEYSGGDNPRFMRAMYQWMVDHDVHFQTEFEAKGKDWHLASGNVPESLTAYQETFKDGVSTDFVARYKSHLDRCETSGSTEENDGEAESESKQYVFVDRERLEEQKRRVRAGKQPWKEAHGSLMQRAKRAAGRSLLSVQDDDGDPDFASENDRHDYRNAIKMSGAARDCGLAYWFTGKDRYARCAVEILHHWTLDNRNYMKPTVEIEKNSTTIEQHITIPAFLYAAAFVRGHAAWSDYDGSKPWESGAEADAEAAFAEWVRDRHATFEPSQPSWCEYNNKWAWRIADRAATAAYLGDDQKVKKAGRMFRARAETTCPDGSTRLRPWNDFKNGDGPHAYGGSASPADHAYFKHELSRESAFGYTAYNLKAFATAAAVFEAYDGRDLWSFHAPQDDHPGSSLHKAFDWFADYVQDRSAWRWNASGTAVDGDAVREATSAYELAYARWGDFQKVLTNPDGAAGRPYWDGRLLGPVTLTHGRP